MAGFVLSKPDYIDPTNTAGVSPASFAPPFIFRNVTLRVFPLRANMAALTAFVNKYLNMDIDPSIVHYAPSIPYVYLMIMNYGSMSVDSVAAQNLGWVAQHEVTFTVPLQRWRWVKDKLVFQDWSAVSPFIYVDDQLSLNNGREVYGWNKVTGVIDATIPRWVDDPRARSLEFDLSVVDFMSTNTGENDEACKLLQIDRDPAPALLEFPLDTRNPWSPLWAVPNAISSAASLLGEAVDIGLAARLRGYEGHRSLDGWGQMAAKVAEKLKNLAPAMTRHGPDQIGLADMIRGLPSLYSEDVTLKQFRNPENPQMACYQALVNSKMGVDRLNRAGLLGEPNLWRGDASGGFRVKIHKYDSQPIVQTLGLDLAGLRTDQDDPSLAIIKPVLPFWLDLDMYYGAGEVICSRANAMPNETGSPGFAPPGVWVDEQGPEMEALAPSPRTSPKPPAAPPVAQTPEGAAPGPPPSSAGPAQTPDPPVVPPPDPPAGLDGGDRSLGAAPPSDNAAVPVATPSGLAPPSTDAAQPYYNTTLGAATQPIAGPFHFPDMTVQVYPLLADRATVAAFLEGYLNGPLAEQNMQALDAEGAWRPSPAWRFEVFSDYIYMTVTAYGDRLGAQWSGNDNIGQFFDREVGFCVPVKWYDGDGRLVTVALVEPFTYSNNGRAVATDREVNGFNSIRASIESPSDAWMNPSGPEAKRRYLRVETEVIPSLFVGQKAQQRPIIEIDERDALPREDDADRDSMCDDWGRILVDDLKRKTYQAYAGAADVDIGKALALEVLANGKPINRMVVKQYRDGEQIGQACYQSIVQVPTTITSIYNISEITHPLHVRLHRHPGHMIADAFGLKIKHRRSVGGEVVDTFQPVRPFWMHVAATDDLGTVAAYRASAEPWKIVHPWFLGDVAGGDRLTQGRPMAGQTSYFRQAGETDVGYFLGAERASALPRLGLKAETAKWLRQSVTNELAWLRVNYNQNQAAGTWTPANIEGLHKALADTPEPIQGRPTMAAEFAGLCSAISLPRFCDSRSVEDLKRLAQAVNDALSQQGLSLPVSSMYSSSPRPPSAPDGPFATDLANVIGWHQALCEQAEQAGSPQTLLFAHEQLAAAQAVAVKLSGHLEAFRGLSPNQQQCFEDTFPDGMRSVLSQAARYRLPDPPDLADERESVLGVLTQISYLADSVEDCMSIWLGPWLWARATGVDAAEAVNALPDVQLIIDGVLSEQWENRSAASRRFKTYENGLPQEFIPDDPDINRQAEREGLTHWHGDPTGLWVLPPAPPMAPQGAQ